MRLCSSTWLLWLYICYLVWFKDREAFLFIKHVQTQLPPGGDILSLCFCSFPGKLESPVFSLPGLVVEMGLGQDTARLRTAAGKWR